MASLDSSSTLAQIRASYADNAGYGEDASPVMAAAFVTACRLLLLKLPKRSVHGGRGAEEIELELGQIRIELDQARQWIALNCSTVPAVRHVDFQTDFRE